MLLFAATAFAADGEWTTVTVAEAGIAFDAPGPVDKKNEDGRVTYIAQADGGETGTQSKAHGQRPPSCSNPTMRT